MIHCAVDTAPPRSFPIGPRATLTIVASRVIIRKPSEIAVSPSVGLRTTVEWASNFMRGCQEASCSRVFVASGEPPGSAPRGY